MSTGLHDVHFYAAARTFLHASVSLLAGILALVLAAFGTGSVDVLGQYTNTLIHSFEPQLDASSLSNAVLFGLLLDGFIGIAVSLLVFNRLHFHRWLPRKQAAQ
jgi:hypothetical protein